MTLVRDQEWRVLGLHVWLAGERGWLVEKKRLILYSGRDLDIQSGVNMI